MKVCLIGSTRFIDKFLEVNRDLSMKGHLVYSVATRSSSIDHVKKDDPNKLTEDQKETLDLVHLLKIQNSDVVVLITDATGYFGFSTRREIKWCMMHSKQILLPEHLKGVNQNMEAFEIFLKEKLAEISPIDLKSKIKI